MLWLGLIVGRGENLEHLLQMKGTGGHARVEEVEVPVVQEDRGK